ncbi:FtsX-like permease family protein [Dactylosporangium sp. CA-139066]|uniref:FtsX-like permease family protein n=1 Tax=Dactylosporangium sp. CA-139066 TaxID=3239930 RepID=UPI003D917EA6
MSVAVQDPPLALGTGNGGMPARRAVVRWAWRLFRREWRQQSIVLALLLVAVATTAVGLAVAANAPSEAAVFGTADHIVTLGSTGAPADADLAQLRGAFGTVEVIEHAKKVPVPGTATGVDLRAQDPHGPYGHVMLRLDEGRWPQGPAEIAVTGRVATLAGLHLGGTWDAGGRTRTVVGIVENPLNLTEAFALVAPGQLGAVDRIDTLLRASQAQFVAKPRPNGSSSQRRGQDGDPAGTLVLTLATIGLVFVGLLSVAGFNVMAQRRLRALGMLGAIGASHRHVRLVLLANGLVIGGAGALAGAATGIVGWIALGPALEPLLGHRIDRFTLPWAPLLLTVALATVTAVAAAWWPARTAARVPVVAALSARPAPPRPAHRFAAIGAVLLAAGLTLLYLAQQAKPPYILGGVLATAVAVLLLAPVGVATIGRLARHAPLATRLAMRDLARYRARSGAALAAIALAIGIAATVALGAAVFVARNAAPTGGALPADQLIVWVSRERMSGPVPVVTDAQLADLRKRADAIAADLHGAAVVPLVGVVDPDAPLERDSGGRPPAVLAVPHASGPGEPGGVMYNDNDMVPFYVATPELLAHYGIDPASVHADTDLLTPRASLAGFDTVLGRNTRWQPVLQHVSLPDYKSLPNVLITQRGMDKLHVTAMPAGWLIDAPGKLTAADIDRAQGAAAAAGLFVESRPTGADQTRLAAQFTAAGIAVALGVLAMTVGLIRSETARDLRTLAAAGARRRTRRALTAATAGSLALAGAVIGTGCTYLAVLAWYHKELHWLAHPPLLNLAAILVGLPIVAYLGGWLLTGREARSIARQPLE